MLSLPIIVLIITLFKKSVLVKLISTIVYLPLCEREVYVNFEESTGSYTKTPL